MNCDYVQTWLLQVDSLLVQDWPRDMNRHLKRCAACAKMARSLYKLEENWRDQPLPAGCDDAKKKFLKMISHPTRPVESETSAAAEQEVRAKPMVRPWHPVRWVGAAAMVLMAVGALAFMLFGPGSTQAAPSDIVDRLIEWNVKLTKADSDDRKKLLEEEPKFREELNRDDTILTAEERQIAEELLESGRWLALNDDPIEEAVRITEISNKLADRAVAAEKRGEKERDRAAVGYDHFMHHSVNPMQKGLTPMFLKFSKDKGFDPKKGPWDKGGFEKGPFGKGGFDKGFSDKKKQMEQLERIWQRTPDRERPELHKKYDGYSKKGGSGSKFGGKR